MSFEIRSQEIQAELMKSFLMRGEESRTPDNETLKARATLINDELSSEVETKHIKALFSISRGKCAHPSVTELKRAWRGEEFLALFPRKMKVDRFIPRSSGDQQASAHAMEDMLDVCVNIFPAFKRRERKV